MGVWRKAASGSAPYQYCLAAGGRLIVHKSATDPSRWVWEAIRDQSDIITPKTHRRSGTAPTMREAKAEAEKALAEMIARNPKGGA